jgi:hypothetical protein
MKNLSDKRKLEMANIAFNDEGRCIKHRHDDISVTGLQSMIEGLNGFQLTEMVIESQKQLTAIQKACDHTYKEHNNKFYCVSCNYKFERERSAGIQANQKSIIYYPNE